MADYENTYDALPSSDADRLQLEDFLMHLRERGFLVTPDTFLEASQVALLLGSESNWSDLKYLLAPIFSTKYIQGGSAIQIVTW